MTRSAAKRSQAIRIYEGPASEESVVAHVYERDLKKYGEAIRSSKREVWEKALRQDLKALEYNGVWRLIKRSPSSNALHTKWVFKTKTDAHGYLERLEARLVACGNEQVFGIYYHLNFAAVMDMATVKVLLAFVATWGVPAKHGDIPNTYVKADKESNIEILLQVTQAMEVDESTLNGHGAVPTPRRLRTSSRISPVPRRGPPTTFLTWASGSIIRSEDASADRDESNR